MKKKFLGRVLTMLLVASMVFTLLPAPAIAAGNWWWNNDEYTEEAVPTATTTADNSNFMRIFHLDCGRKYFSVDEIKGIIDQLAANNYTHIELAFGNDGLRFLLKDMSLTVNGTKYESDDVKGAIQEGNKNYHNAGEYNELTESQMTDIITYARGRNIGVIPLIDIPGHTNALVYAMKELGISEAYYVSNTNSTGRETLALNVTDAAAVSFATELVKKYVDYFAANGAAYFNVGADECGYDGHYAAADYQALAAMIGNLSDYIYSKEMTTLIFNDGFRTNGYLQTALREKSNQIKVCYWTYSEYTRPTDLAQDFELINTHNKWYYVAGNEGSGWYGYRWAKNNLNGEYKDCTIVDGAKDENYRTNTGCMLAYWCDDPSKTYNSENVADLIKTLADNNPDYFKSTAAPDKPGTKLEKTINVTVGGTATDTIKGANYAGTYSTEHPNIATVTVTGQDGTPESATYTEEQVYIGDIAVSSSWEKSANNYYKVGENYYPVYCRKETTYQYGFAWGAIYYYGYSKTDSSSDVMQIGEGMSYAYTQVTVYVKGDTVPATPASTIVTFNGLAEGDTYVTIGNVHYTIHVTKEDLSNAPTLPIQLWITNNSIEVDGAKQTTGSFANGGWQDKPWYLLLNAKDNAAVASSAGLPLAECIPATIENRYQYNTTYWKNIHAQAGPENMIPYDFVVWKGKVLNQSTGLQLAGNTSRVNAGADNDFQYIRYYGGKWQVSADRVNWKKVTGDGTMSSYTNCSEQIVAYYKMRTVLTDEVTTDVVDWGDPVKNQDKYALLDFAVKYPSGTRKPDKFIQPEKTRVYYIEGNVGLDGNYRLIDEISVVNKQGFEVYMITLTPATGLSGTISSTTQYQYEQTGEKVIWVDKVEDLPDDFKDSDRWYVALTTTGASRGLTFDAAKGKNVGGDAIVPMVEIEKNGGTLVTYYIRPVKEETDTLQVNYVDLSDKKVFYDYSIAVKSGTTFEKEPTLTNGKLEDYTIEGLKATETVYSDLTKMDGVPAAYRYATNITCVRVERSQDHKTLTLYYSFGRTTSFVVDFGLPVTIQPGDLNTTLGTNIDRITKVSAVSSDGTASVVGKNVVFTPNKVYGVGSAKLAITYSGTNLVNNKENSVTYTIDIYPASNVLYEENFLTQSGESGLSWTKGTSTAPTTPQQTQKANGTGSYNVFGRDAVYDAVTGELGVWKIENLKPGQSYPCLSTTFYGNGFDLIGNCSPTTGRVFLLITDLSGKGVKAAIVDTRYNSAGANGIYQVPLAHLELEEGTYIAEVRASGLTDSSATRSAVMQASSLNADIDEFASVLAKCGLTMADVEFIEMSSGTAKPANRVPSYYAASVAEAATFAADTQVEIDGFRVYRSTTDAVAMNYYPANEQRMNYQNIIKVMANKVITAYSDNGVIQNCEISEYQKQGGPKKEIYLKQGQSISFDVQGHDNLQVSLRAVTGSAQANVVDKLIATNTEMYYTIGRTEGLFTISNTGEGILAIGNVKLPDGAVVQTVDDLDEAAVFASVRAAFNAQPDAPDQGAFAPEIFNVGGKTTRMFRNKIVTLRVKVSADVDYVTIDNDVYRTNKWTARLFGYSTITVTKIVRSGDSHEYSVVAYNAQGQASAAKTWGY